MKKLYYVIPIVLVIGIIIGVGIYFTPKDLGNNGFFSPQTNTIVVINQPLQWQATSTAANPAPLAKYLVNQDMFCDTPILDISAGQGRFGSNISVGTTTALDNSLTNTSTASLMALTHVATTTVGFSIPGDGVGMVFASGSYYGTGHSVYMPYLMRSGSYFVVYSDMSGATSSDSFTQNFTGAGKLKVKCIVR